MIMRQFVTLGEQQVHLRRAGEGPPVLMLHDLPNSSRLLAPAIETVAAAGFTALAPDLCGYGNSDPLPGAPTIAACADVFKRLVEALGVERFGLFGGHTGARVAAELAGRSPEKVVATVLSGYALFSPEERAEYNLHFFPDLEMRWDGGHLAWLWARMREQMIFFPWHAPAKANRLSYDIPPPEVLQGRAVDWLRGIKGHGGLYKAVFNENPRPPLDRLPPSTVIAYWAQDVLAPHRERLPALPPGVTSEIVEGDRNAVAARLGGWLAPARHLPPVPPARPATAPQGRLFQDFADAPGGQIALRRVIGRGRRLLLLHDAGGSSALLTELAGALGERRAVIAPDLPGHGESAPPSGEGLEAYLAPILSLLDGEPVDVLGFGLGAAIGIELAHRRPDLVASCAISGLAPLPEALVAELVAEGAPSIAARWDGGHLLTAWHRTRDGRLFWPWYRRGRAGVRGGEPAVETADLQRAVTELLKAGDYYRQGWRVWAEYPTAARVAALRRAPVVISAPDDPLAPFLDAWPGADVRRVDGPTATWAGTVVALSNA